MATPFSGGQPLHRICYRKSIDTDSAYRIPFAVASRKRNRAVIPRGDKVRIKNLIIVFLALPILGFSGCAPQLIQDYAVRDDTVVFAVQQGNSYTLGECRRAPDGKLSGCQLYDVEFD